MRPFRSRILWGVLLLTVGSSVAQPSVLAAQQDLPEVVRPVLEQAERQRLAGRVEEAIAGFRRVLELDPNVVAAYVALGALYHQQGQSEAALEIFKTGLEHSPDEPDLLFNAAVLSLGLERLEEALGYCEGALRRSPNEAVLHSLRGRILRRLGRTEEAVANHESAVRLAPGDAQAHFRLGNLYHEVGRPDDAIESFRKAIKRQRDLLRAHYNLGAVLYEEGRFEEALEAYQIALRPIDQAFARGNPVDLVHAQAYANLGAIYAGKGDAQRAVEAYLKSLRLVPEQPAALYNLGYLHYQQGQGEEAYDTYQRALAFDRAMPLAYFHLGEIDRRRGRHQDSAKWLEQGLVHFDVETKHKALLMLAQSYLTLGDRPKSGAAYRQVLAAHPDDRQALAALGKQLRDQGELAEARPLLERALLQQPQDVAVALELAALVGATGDRQREMALYRQILAQDGEQGEMWPVRLSLASRLLETGATAEAREELGPVVRRLLNRPGPAANGGGRLPPPATQRALVTAYGLLRVQEGALAEANRLFKRVLDTDPGFAPAREASAVLKALDGKIEASARDLEQVVPQLQGKVEALARGNLGQVLWLAGRPREAQPHLEAAATAIPAWLSPRLVLGEIVLASRQFSRAIDLFAQVEVSCSESPAPLAGPDVDVAGLHLFLGEDRGWMCRRARQGRAASLVGRSVEELDRALARGASGQRARDLAESALNLPIEAANRALALFVRGTTHLLDGADQVAARDLGDALSGTLSPSLRPLAQNNLGIALYRLGRTAEARRHFETARPAQAATLNLGILLDESREKGEALRLYQGYLDAGGARQEEVREWIDRLRRMSQ